ncbi:MAG: AAA family ATPase [Woeseia sp.]
MRLIRVSLENWRGVANREVAFDEHVTLIEGPNEIGKSTIIEAIRMLFRVPDSSSQKIVKAVQPAGQDTGSRVEAEVRAGDYHFVYEKTYNKNKQTTLNILSPKKEQLTSREAHDRVEAIMAESVDMTLWDALLVSQGKEIAQASLNDSESLSNALDEAVGTAAAGSEDAGLVVSVRKEYERYFTPRSGKEKFLALESEREEALRAVEAARAVMAAVEDDTQKHDRCKAEVLRLKKELPALRQKVQEHEQKWQFVSSLQDQVKAAETAHDSAKRILQAAIDVHDRRAALRSDIADSESRLRQVNARREPLEQSEKELALSVQEAQREAEDCRSTLKAAKAALRLASDDEAWLRKSDELRRTLRNIAELEEIASRKTAFRDAIGSIRVDEPGLERLRTAEKKRDIALSQRDTATTKVVVQAEQSLKLLIDGHDEPLAQDGFFEQKVTSDLELRIPGVASFRITPSRSVSELQEELAEAERLVADLLESLAAGSLADAVAKNERRLEAQRELAILDEREKAVSQQSGLEELRNRAKLCRQCCDAYVQVRGKDPALPEDLQAASARVELSRKTAEQAERDFESAQHRATELQHQSSAVNSDLRVLREEIKGLQSAADDKRARLEAERTMESDESACSRKDQEMANVEQLQAKLAALSSNLADAAPDKAQSLLANAKAAQERAGRGLQEEEQKLAVLQDRLTMAQADGRFEKLETAEARLAEIEAELASTRRRAAAVNLLWSTLSSHRDAARQAYVRPLKQAIEELAAIVFGHGCEVEIGDDWNLLSRSLDGATIPFEDLSIGAQEQLGIIARLAAAQIISTAGGVPLIIDDALGFSDPARLESMGAAIASVGRRCQIILITCTPGRFTYVGSAVTVKL